MLVILFHYRRIKFFGMLFHNYKYTCMNFLQIIESLTKATTATITHIPAVSMKLKDLKSRQSYKSSSEVLFFMILFWWCIRFCNVSFHSNCYDDSTIFILGIQRIFGITTAIRRQGFIGSLSGIAPVAVAGAATAGVFRNEIAAIVEDLVSEFLTT